MLKSLFIICLTLTTTLLSAAPLPDASMWMTNGSVYAVTSNSTQKRLIVGGAFDYAGPKSGAGVLVEADAAAANYGRPIANWPQVNGQVHAVLADGAGGWFIGGAFSQVGAVARNNLARIDSSGTVLAWDPDINNTVYALASDGTDIYIGGAFTSVGPDSRNNIAKVNIATGIASTWNPGANGIVRALVLSSTGAELYVGGEFTAISGVNPQRYIAGLNASTAAPLAWAVDANATVYTLALSADDATLYAGGDFTSIGGLTRSRLAALTAADGTAQAGWSADANGTVRALALSPSTLYVGGDFNSADDVSASIGTQPRDYLARLNPADGSVLSWNPQASDSIHALTLASDNATLYVGGNFTRVAGLDRSRLAAFETTGHTVLSWNPATGDTVDALAENAARVFVAGQFQSLGGVQRKNLASFDIDMASASFGQAQTWNPQPDNVVYSLLLSTDESTLYVGGDFTVIGGQFRNRLAAVNMTTAAALSWNPQANAAVRVLQPAVATNNVLVGGDFTVIGGQNKSGFAEVLLSNSSVLPGRPSVDGSVYAIARKDNVIYLAGQFGSLNNGTVIRTNLAAFDSTDNSIQSWNPGVNALVRAILLAADGASIYVAGDFTILGSLGDSRGYLGAVDLATAQATLWAPTSDNRVHTLQLAMDNTRLYVGGEFVQLNGITRNRLAAVDPADGTVITDDGSSNDWYPDTDDTVRVLALSRNGLSLYAGGDYTHMAGQPQRHVAVLDALPLDAQPPVTMATPTGTAFNSQTNQPVVLSCDDGGGVGCAQTFYSLNGGAFAQYTEPLLIESDSTLTFYSVDALGNQESPAKSESYTAELTPPTTVISPSSQVFDSAQLMISFSCTDDISGCANTYYTLDDSQPTTAASVYNGPFAIHSSTVVKFFSTDNAGNAEEIRRASFVSIYKGGVGAMQGGSLLLLLFFCYDRVRRWS